MKKALMTMFSILGVLVTVYVVVGGALVTCLLVALNMTPINDDSWMFVEE